MEKNYEIIEKQGWIIKISEKEVIVLKVNEDITIEKSTEKHDNHNLINELKKLEWLEVTSENNILYLTIPAPKEQKYSILLPLDDSLENIVNKVETNYYMFDASKETFDRLDSNGNALNYPIYSLAEVYEAMLWCEDRLNEIRVILIQYLSKN